MPARPKIGAQIRRARQLLDMRQQDLADALGVSRNTVDSWENDRAYPQRTLARLEQVLGVSLEPAPEPGPLDDLKVDGRWPHPGEAEVAEDPDIPDDIKRRMITDWRRARSEEGQRRQRRRNGAHATGAA